MEPRDRRALPGLARAGQRLRWLDVGCGIGAFTELILKRCAPATIADIDPAPAPIEHACKHPPQADFRVADAIALPFADDDFDVMTSTLVINFIPDRLAAFREIRSGRRAGLIVHAGGGMFLLTLSCLMLIWVCVWNAWSLLIASFHR